MQFSRCFKIFCGEYVKNKEYNIILHAILGFWGAEPPEGRKSQEFIEFGHEKLKKLITFHKFLNFCSDLGQKYN